MFLKKNSCKNGRIFLTFTQGYRDASGKIKHKTIEKIGYLDELQKEFDDPITHFKEVAKQKTSDEITEYTIKNLNTKKIEMNSNSKNLGYSVLKQVYKELGIKDVLNNAQAKSQIKFNLNDILSFLVFMRVLKPGSKRDAFNNKDLLFEKCDFSLDDIYRSLTSLNPLQEIIQKNIWDNTKDTYNRDTSTTYYDCTNYYFEIEYNDEDTYELDFDGNVIKDDKGNPVIKSAGLRKRGP